MSVSRVEHPGTKSATLAPRQERRRRKRAKISAQVHVRAAASLSGRGHAASEAFEEVCLSVDVSRDGLLFNAMQSGYWKGQVLDVTFPYSAAASAINTAQPAEVVRVTAAPEGAFAVAVRFLTAERAVGESASGASAGKNSPMVLGVESDARMAEIMRTLLAEDGYDARIVPTAGEALEILKAAVPAVFLAEVESEEMSGHDLCLIVKRNERLQHVPVILITRSGKPADYSTSHSLGAVVCLARPFKPERLQHVIRLVAPPPIVPKSHYSRGNGNSSQIERYL